MSKALKYEAQLLMTAMMFYTRIPVTQGLPYSQNRLNLSRKYFPAIGIFIGTVCSLCFVIASPFVGINVAIVISMCVSVFATGAFHEDGFADSCDGLGGGWEKESVLTIMKDSRIGTYGAVGLIAILALKATTLIQLVKLSSLPLFLMVYVCGHTLSRQLSSSAIELFDYVQDIDQSKVKPVTERHLPRYAQYISFTLTAIPILILLAFNFEFIIAVLVASFIAWGFLHYSKSRIGGYTGDILGASQQISEVSFYIIALVVLTSDITSI